MMSMGQAWWIVGLCLQEVNAGDHTDHDIELGAAKAQVPVVEELHRAWYAVVGRSGRRELVVGQIANSSGGHFRSLCSVLLRERT